MAAPSIALYVISYDDGGWDMEKEQALGIVFLILTNHSPALQ